VATQNCLVIFLRHDDALVVCIDRKISGRDVLACFTAAAESDAEHKHQQLAGLIAKGCTERQLVFDEVIVALDCAMFMQHHIHSEFTDLKQLASTVRFDAEQELATDISDLAIAFDIVSNDSSGCDLIVFTIAQKQLSNAIISLQANGFDPISCEPDVVCLGRFITQTTASAADSNTVFCLFSESNGYIISFSKSAQIPVSRTFLLTANQNRAELLARELPLTSALVFGQESLDCVKVFDSTETVDCQALGEKLGVKVEPFDLPGFLPSANEALADNKNPVGLAIACGAACSDSDKGHLVNFRKEFMPYQGRRMQLQKAIQFFSVAMVFLVLAIGLYFQSQLFARNKYRGQLRKKLEKQYSAVMFSKKVPPSSRAVKKLSGELRRIRDVKSGQLSITGQESAAAKLTLVLTAFNKCASKTNLNIDSITIGAKSINVSGSTSSRKNTLELFKQIKETDLNILQQRLDTKADRDSFNISVTPKGGQK